MFLQRKFHEQVDQPPGVVQHIREHEVEKPITRARRRRPDHERLDFLIAILDTPSVAIPANQARYHVDLLAFLIGLAILVTGRDERVVRLEDHEACAVTIVGTEDFTEHTPMWETRGRDNAKQEMEEFLSSFSDFSATVEDIIAEDDTVAMRVTLQGTHDGEFQGIDPTGADFEVQNMVFTGIEDGKIAEWWIQPDMLGMMRQFGVIEQPTQ